MYFEIHFIFYQVTGKSPKCLKRGGEKDFQISKDDYLRLTHIVVLGITSSNKPTCTCMHG